MSQLLISIGIGFESLVKENKQIWTTLLQGIYFYDI